MIFWVLHNDPDEAWFAALLSNSCLIVVLVCLDLQREHLRYRDVLPSLLWVLVPLPVLLADEDEFSVLFHMFGMIVFLSVFVLFSCKKDPRGDWHTITACLAKTY